MSTAGMILAAGTGSRLAPLTAEYPKPMLPIGRRPLLGILLDRLVAAGVDRICVNTHHLPEEIERYLSRVSLPVEVVLRREATLTGPAGAVPLFADVFARHDRVLVLSGDVLIGCELPELMARHDAVGAGLTFAVTQSLTGRHYGVLELDSGGRVRRAREKPDVPDGQPSWISCGVYCLAPVAVEWLVRKRRERTVLDYARDLAPGLIADGVAVHAHPLNTYWRDIGSFAAYLAANLDAVAGRVPDLAAEQHSRYGRGVFVDERADLGRGVTIEGPAVIGAGAVLADGCQVAGSIVMPHTRVPPGAVLKAVIASRWGELCP